MTHTSFRQFKAMKASKRIFHLLKIPILTSLIVLATVQTVFAAAAGGGGPGLVDFSAFTGLVDSVTGLAVGPYAKMVATIGVIGAAVAMSKEDNMGHALGHFGPIALVIGLLLSSATLLNAVGASI